MQLVGAGIFLEYRDTARTMVQPPLRLEVQRLYPRLPHSDHDTAGLLELTRSIPGIEYDGILFHSNMVAGVQCCLFPNFVQRKGLYHADFRHLSQSRFSGATSPSGFSSIASFPA